MNTRFHYDGLGLFRKTEAYLNQRKAYKEQLILKYADQADKPKGWLLRMSRSLKMAFRMFIYSTRLLF